AFRLPQSPFILHRGGVELPVLRERTGWVDGRLIYGLRIDAFATSNVVPLINERGAVILKPIVIGRVRSDRGENDGVVAADPEVHAALEAGPLPLAHLEVRQDLVVHGYSRSFRS